MGARAQTGRHSFTGEGALRTCKRCSVADAATSGASCGMLIGTSDSPPSRVNCTLSTGR